MGVSGVPLPITHAEIKEAIKKHKGVVSSVCKTLNMGHNAFYVRMAEDPTIKQCLDEARSEFDDFICDLSENVLTYALSQRDDLSSALGSAKYVLNNKGKKRGYSPIPVSNENKDTEILEVLNGIKSISENSGGKIVEQPGMETEQSLSHSQ